MNAKVALDPRETTTEKGAERGSGESTGVSIAAAVAAAAVVVVVEVEHAPPRASVAQQAPDTAERYPVTFPAFLRVTKTGPPPAPGAHES